MAEPTQDPATEAQAPETKQPLQPGPGPGPEPEPEPEPTLDGDSPHTVDVEMADSVAQPEHQLTTDQSSTLPIQLSAPSPAPAPAPTATATAIPAPAPAPAPAPQPQHTPMPFPSSSRNSPHPSAPAQAPTQPIPHGSPTRIYLNQNVTPHLLEAMKHLATSEPDKPLKWLSEFLAQKSAEIEGA